MSAVKKLLEARTEKLKGYKVSFDVDRALALAHTAHLLRDFPAHSALSGGIVRELTGMNAKQLEINTEENEKEAKEMAAAVAEDSKPAEEEDKSNPPHAPSVRRT